MGLTTHLLTQIQKTTVFMPSEPSETLKMTVGNPPETSEMQKTNVFTSSEASEG